MVSVGDIEGWEEPTNKKKATKSKRKPKVKKEEVSSSMDTADESSEKETRRDSKKKKTLTKKKSKKGKGKARSPSSASEGEADSELADSELPVKPTSRIKPAPSITKPSTIKSTSSMDTSKRKIKAMMPSEIDDDSEEDLGTFYFNSVYRRQATNERSFKRM